MERDMVCRTPYMSQTQGKVPHNIMQNFKNVYVEIPQERVRLLTLRGQVLTALCCQSLITSQRLGVKGILDF